MGKKARVAPAGIKTCGVAPAATATAEGGAGGTRGAAGVMASQNGKESKSGTGGDQNLCSGASGNSNSGRRRGRHSLCSGGDGECRGCVVETGGDGEGEVMRWRCQS